LEAGQLAAVGASMKRVDHTGLFRVGVPTDIGWAIAILHDDHTLTRTCKGCGVEARSAIGPAGRVDEARIHHRAGCTVIDRLERLTNNPRNS
jgi:hypothetical protein